MLTATQSASVSMARRPSVLLWAPPADLKPNILALFLKFCRGCDDYVWNGFWRRGMDGTLCRYGRYMFRPVPSRGVVIGLSAAWSELRKILLADDSFTALVQANEKSKAAGRFQSLKAALIWFRLSLDQDVRAVEARRWLDAIGWQSILALAGKRDKAAERLIAGTAIVGPASKILALPSAPAEVAA
ncbi:hypothetical protein JRX38_06055 [Gluconobacter cerinus]|uniref:hypothetical protein n=1 Tax=Gluconobacter cerinus TaxID=38307 RepID=UPI00193EEE59|nr:hypothetical protein [Gluconobacter cerinus]MBM3097584.1 hypothetical protein [Gluconobacter cerinus]